MSLPYLQPYLGLSNGLNTLHAAGAGGAVGGWVELGRTTLGGTADEITVSSLADKRYYMVLSHILDGGIARNKVRVGNSSIDTGSNYSIRTSQNGSADGTGINENLWNLTVDGTDDDKFSIGYIANYASKEKLSQWWTIERGLVNATDVGGRMELVGKWANTSNVIDTIQFLNDSTGDYVSGSEVVVLGYDPADTHTNNFWEELVSVTASGSSTNFSTGTFTAKKYLWVQIFTDGGSSINDITFNNDTGSNYARRYNLDGGGDATETSASYLRNILYPNGNPSLGNMFIINNASTAKLVISHSVNTAPGSGAGFAPQRLEGIGKWANTSNQITEIDFDTQTNWSSGSIIKVWGAD
jgi:hypothetical protein